MSRILIVGAGGQGRVVADGLLRMAVTDSALRLVGFLDDDTRLHGRTLLGIPILGGLDRLAHLQHDCFVVAIGDNAVRRRVALESAGHGRPLITMRHPASVVAPDVVVGDGTMISAQATVVTGTRIGRGCIVNTGCVVDHDSDVADWVHIAPRAVLGGQVSIGEGALVGIGASIMPGITVGAGAIVGAGAVVTKDVEPETVVVGVPARPMPPSRGSR
jgi:acetyltransferase EpsM